MPQFNAETLARDLAKSGIEYVPLPARPTDPPKTAAQMLATEGVGENKGISKLTSAHDKTRAIDGPFTF